MSGFRRLREDEAALPEGLYDRPWGAFHPGLVQRMLIGLARRTVLRRGKLRAWTTRLVMDLGRPLDIEFRGCRYRIDGLNNLMNPGLLLNPAYNGLEIDFLAAGCPPGSTFVDIGANIGLYSLPLARQVGPQGRVLAIDANRRVLAELAFNAAASGLDQVMTVNEAVGAHEGRVELDIRLDDLAIVAVREEAGGGVRMRPLAAILAEAGVGRVAGLKIDIEGFEDQALVPYLRGTPVADLPSRIVMEYAGIDGGDYPGAAAELARLGYRLVGRTRNNSMYLRDG